MPSTKATSKSKQLSFEQVNQQRAKVIEEIMRLRHEQARLKMQLVEQAMTSGRSELMNAIVRCW